MRRHSRAPSSGSTMRQGRHRRPLFGLACLSVLALGALLGGTALPAAASTAEPCPNEAVRQQQGSTRLPDCRGYELVSLPGQTPGRITYAAISPDGKRVAYGQTAGTPSYMTATRTATGPWVSTSMTPPPDQLIDDGLYSSDAMTPDRSNVFFTAQLGFIGIQSPTTPLRIDQNGVQTLFTTLPVAGNPGAGEVVVSDDGQHAFAAIAQPFDPGHVVGTRNVYDFAASPPVLVSRLPDGSVPACGVQDGSNAGFVDQAQDGSAMQHWTSRDGRYVFFGARTLADCSDPRQLYRRDLVAGTTTLITASPAPGTDSDARFLQATSDGSAAIYVTAASLDPADTNTNPDVYRWTQGSGNSCLTCLASDANVNPEPEEFGISEDLSHVYFISQNQLAAGANPGDDNLYVWHRTPSSGPGGAIDFIAPIVANASSLPLINHPSKGATLTPDGNVIVFRSFAPALNGLTASDNGGFAQYYRYDDRVGPASLSCVSCPQGTPATSTGGTTGDDSGPDGYQRVLSDDGSRFFFRTADALVPTDVNNGPDIYEWHDGQVGLISDGVSDPGAQNQANNALREVSADGTDVIFTAFAKLTPEATNDSMNLYDARIGGGIFQSAPAPACSGEACQGQPTPPPAGANPASSDFSGPGNPRPRRRHKHRHHSKHRSHHRTANNNRGGTK